jgi:hypothetical protein
VQTQFKMSSDSVIDQNEPFVWKSDDDDDDNGGPGGLAPNETGNFDPKDLPGSFLFLTVKPKLRSGARGSLEFPGTFNAIAYDPDFKESEGDDTIRERYKTKPPYLEQLTARGKEDTAVDFKRTAFGK